MYCPWYSFFSSFFNSWSSLTTTLCFKMVMCTTRFLNIYNTAFLTTAYFWWWHKFLLIYNVILYFSINLGCTHLLLVGANIVSTWLKKVRPIFGFHLFHRQKKGSAKNPSPFGRGSTWIWSKSTFLRWKMPFLHKSWSRFSENFGGKKQVIESKDGGT